MLFIVFVLAPAVFGLWISLTNWSPFRDTQKFIGLQNYIDLFTPGSATSGDFWQSMAATGIFTLAQRSVPAGHPAADRGAAEPARSVAGSFFRGVFFAPYVLGVAVISVIWKYLLDTQSGIINHLLGMIGLPDNLPWTVDVPWVWVSLAGRHRLVDDGLQHRDHPGRASRASALISTRRRPSTARARAVSSPM